MSGPNVSPRSTDSLASLVAEPWEDASVTRTSPHVAEGCDPLEILDECERGLRQVDRR